jgi:L-threonylcarbamoyladenylate synthase
VNQAPKIAILFETFHDFQIVKRHLGLLNEWQVPYVMTLASALKSPERLANWIAQQEQAGVEVFVVAVGGAANLAGAVAAQTDRPVVGVPLDTSHLRGQDALQAMTGLPVGIPVATMGINNVENAFYCALRLLALRHSDYLALLERLRAEWPKKEIESLENLRDQYPEFFRSKTAEKTEVSISVEPAPVQPTAPRREEGAGPPAAIEIPVQTKDLAAAPAPGPAARRAVRRIVVNPLQPDVAAVEEVADTLLEGGIVALPTDTVYGLAALSTKKDAVRRLYGIKGREGNKPIALLIHSTRGLSRLVREVPEAARPLLEELWPGPLTLVFRKYPGSFPEVSSDDTVGLRMPDHVVTLAVISMLAQPLAVTSANVSGKPPAVTADQALELFGDLIECVLDGGPTPGERVSTVLSLAETPFRVLREGAIPYARLKAILGENLAEM